MDTTKAITHVSLCAGYGGIDLGLKRAIPNLRTVAFAEIEGFACANLVAKMEARLLDPAPIWTNVKTFPWASFHGKVDILSGGYPCQPFSAAGKRLGKDDPRHLWPWIADGIRAMQPGLCFFENVEGHISLGLREVIGELESLGYRTMWGLFSAAEVGAPHQRKRVFIMAHLSGSGLEGFWFNSRSAKNSEPRNSNSSWPSRPGQPQHEWEPPRVVADGERVWKSQPQGCIKDERGRTLDSSESLADARILHGTGWGARSGRRSGCEVNAAAGNEKQHRQTKPSLGRDVDGPANRLDDAELYITSDNRTDELRLLGNGVVPATAERAFRTLSFRLLP
jgi:DNA (cytosine-5)-methyltransferase 1